MVKSVLPHFGSYPHYFGAEWKAVPFLSNSKRFGSNLRGFFFFFFFEVVAQEWIKGNFHGIHSQIFALKLKALTSYVRASERGNRDARRKGEDDGLMGQTGVLFQVSQTISLFQG